MRQLHYLEATDLEALQAGHTLRIESVQLALDPGLVNGHFPVKGRRLIDAAPRRQGRQGRKGRPPVHSKWTRSFTCPDCGRRFRGLPTYGNHRRYAHPKQGAA
jgi:hypothetical protein